MKKILAVCFIAAMALGFASCSKDSDDSAPSSLVGTTWQADDDPQGSIVFSTTTEGTMVYASESTSFTYTYSDGSGTITMHGETGTFTVKGNKMTVTAPNGRSETFTQVSGGNGGGGGGTPSASLVGTNWAYTHVDGSNVELTRLSFISATNVTLTMYVDGSVQYNVTTTYSYNSNSGSGILYAPQGETGDVPFTVSGNYLYAMEMVFQKE